MKQKQKIIAIILLCCTSIWLSTKALQKLGTAKLNKSYQLSKKVSKIIITQNKESFTLIKNKNNNWLIEGITANNEKIKTVLKAIETLGNKKLISKNKNKHAIYHVTTANKTITLKQQNKRLLSLVIGKQGPTWNSTYIRFRSKNNVYLINQPLASIITNEKNTWQELKINPFLTQDIKTISITINNQITSFELINNNWINKKENSLISMSSINKLLTALTTLTASEVTLKSEKNIPIFFNINLKNHTNKSIDYSFFPISNEKTGVITSQKPNQIFSINTNITIELMQKINSISPL